MGCTASSESPIEYIDFADKCVSDSHEFHEEKISIVGKSNTTSQRNVGVWLPLKETRIKGVVFVSHGLGEHGLCYYHVAAAFVQKNYAVYAIDHVAHGKSDGRKGIIPDISIAQDFVQFVNLKRALHPNVPVFIIAHSMGTLVVLNALPLLSDISAVVLSGAAIFSGPAASSPFGIRALYPLTKTSFAAGLTSVTSTLDPGGPAAPIIVEEITSNEQVREEMARDPRRCPPVVTNKTARVLLNLISNAKAIVPKLTLPIICIHGEVDQLILKSSSEYVYSNIGTAPEHKKLFILPDRKHEVFNEPYPYGEQAIGLAVDFVEEHFARSTSIDSSGIVIDTENIIIE